MILSKNNLLRLFLSLLFCNIIIGAIASDKKDCSDTSHRLIIAGYLANYRMENYNLDNLKYVDRLYYFSVCPNENGGLEIPEKDIENIKLIKSKLSPSQSLFLVVGGWTQSKNIPYMASKKSRRKAFVKNVTEFCKTSGLQGVDLDWEDYPAEVNKEDFAKLVKDFYKGLHSEGLAFTIALGVSDKKIKMAVSSLPYVNEINIMSYGKFDAAGNQAPMNLLQGWLQDYVNASVPKEKLIVGVPFYGKRLANKNDNSPVAVPFAEIISQTQPDRSVNWFKNYSYNGLQLIREKTKFLRENGYRGIMA